MFSYLDAGTGSMIVTAITGGVAGIAVAGRMFFQRVKSKVTGKSASGSTSTAPETTTDAADGSAS